jgi:adenosylcobinamide-GDP ribazoletransferase
MQAWQLSRMPPSIIGIDPVPLTDLISAFMLLTRLPVGRFARFGGPPDLARCVWAFPVVGLVVNGTAGLVYWLAHKLGMSPLLSAVWTLAASMIMTGALHEDGLADTADGFGGGRTAVRKMEIMRDSSIGSYGALALLLSTIARVAAIASLDRPLIVMTGMILAGTLGRSGIVLLLLVLSPARKDGLGASMGTPRTVSAVLGLVLAVAGSVSFLPIRIAAAAVLCGVGAALLLARLAQVQVGGYTGDVLGAGEIVTECAVLTVLACAWGVTT